jgi:hypothetical protein
MNSLFKIFLLSFVTLSIFSCKGKKGLVEEKDPKDVFYEEGDFEASKHTPLAEKEYKAVAKELCDCSQDLISLREEVKKLTDAGDIEGLNTMMPRMRAASEKMETCVEKLEKKYPALKETGAEEEEKLREALKKHCPELSQIMGE